MPTLNQTPDAAAAAQPEGVTAPSAAAEVPCTPCRSPRECGLLGCAAEKRRSMTAATRCECGDRESRNCPGAWEPGCDLGNSEEHARVAPDQTERAKVAAPPAQAEPSEVVTWTPAANGLPDTDITVLLSLDESHGEPTFAGYWDGERWLDVGGNPITGVLGWADMPRGLRTT